MPLTNPGGYGTGAVQGYTAIKLPNGAGMPAGVVSSTGAPTSPAAGVTTSSLGMILLIAVIGVAVYEVFK